jgi:hypothetical protein
MKGARGVPTVLLAAVVAVTGCRSNFATEADALREQVLELERSNEQLARRIAELESELAEVSAMPGSLPEDVRAAQPHVVEIRIGRLSHVDDVDGDGRPDLLRVYVRPLDGLGRFVQLVGRLSISAALMPEGRPAVTVGQIALEPMELRSAYRSGLTGTHYTIECPLDVPEGTSEEDLVVSAVFTDGATGQRHSAHQTVRWQ